MIGLLWNPRLLPFLYLTRLLLMMVGIVELVHYVRAQLAARPRRSSPRTPWITGVATAGRRSASSILIVVAVHLP